jgi:class 3 adenylate cyclase
MAIYIHDKNPASLTLGDQLKALPKTPGICMFIDIVGSTAEKYQNGVEVWGKKLNNTFNFISFLNNFPKHIVKGIGDEIMLYIPDDELTKHESLNSCLAMLEEIYATLDNIINFPLPDLFMNCKVAMHYCTEVYNITFLENYNDYYGIDIDMTARLTKKAVTNRIVISETFFKKVVEDLAASGRGYTPEVISKISDKYIEDFKGVPEPVELRVIDV